MTLTKIFSNSLAVFLLEIVGKIIPLLTLPYVARTLGPEMYGKAGFAMSIVGFFGFIASPGLLTYGTRELAREPDQVDSLINRIFGARLIFAFFAYGLLALYAFTAAPAETATRSLILLAGLGLFISCFDMQWVFASQSRMWVLSATGIVSQLAPLFIMLRFVRSPADASVFVASAFASSSIITIFIFVLTCRQYKTPKPNLAPASWIKLFPVTITLGLSGLMVMIYHQMDVILIGYLRSTAEVGMYTASTKVMELGLSFIFFVSQVFFPILSKAVRDKDSEKQYLQWMVTGMTTFALPVSILGVILAKPLTELILGAQFNGTENLVRWNMLNVTIVAFAIIAGHRLITNKREKQYLIGVFSGAVLNVALNLLLLKTYGPIVASIATVASEFWVSTINFYFGRDLPKPDWFKAAKVPLTASLALVAVVLPLSKHSEVPVLLQLFAGVLVYAASYWLLQKMSKQSPVIREMPETVMS